MKRKWLTLKLITVIAVTSVLFGVASCHVNSTEKADINTAAGSSEITESATEPQTVPAESMTELAPITVATTTTETQEETTTTTTEEETSATTEKVIKGLSPEWVRELPQAQDLGTNQMLIVAASGMDKTTCKVSMHERDGEGNWIQIFSVDGYVGKKGMVLDSERKEGCGKTPIGVYYFNKAFGIADDPGCSIPYIKVTKDLYWSGDMRDGMCYNEMVSINDLPELDVKNSEHLIDYTKAYQYCLNISFNEECTPGRGSAIFLHCMGNNKYTAGCVAVSKDTMIKIMKRVDPDCVVIIDLKSNLGA
jgi:L,D-peptidoglycan transpeptidase YkuD (ErfK/YbiS/YcfS/YnhG family)